MCVHVCMYVCVPGSPFKQRQEEENVLPGIFTVMCVPTNVIAFSQFTVQYNKCYHQFAYNLLLQFR